MQGTNWLNVAQQCVEDMATKDYTRHFQGGCAIVVGNPKHNSRRLTVAVQHGTAEFVRYGVSIDRIYAALLEAQAYFKALA